MISVFCGIVMPEALQITVFKLTPLVDGAVVYSLRIGGSVTLVTSFHLVA